MAEVLSLPEAAEALGVHYMTAYRYVRTGRLPAAREGAEWRIERRDVDRMRTAAAHPRPGRAGHPGRAAARARLRSRMLAADEAGAWAVIESALAGGAAPADIHLELLAPALADIGDAWAARELTIADEHRASTVAARLVGRLGPRFARRGRRRGTVVVGAVAGELHGLPGLLLADLLRGTGFDVVDLGAQTPADSFVEVVTATPRLVAVVVGGFTDARRPELAGTLTRLRAAGVDAPLLAGGRAVKSVADARALGADGWSGADGSAAVDAVVVATTGAQVHR